MPSDSNTHEHELEKALLTAPRQALKFLIRILLKMLGDIDISGAYKSPAPMGHWNVEVIAKVTLSAGEWLLGAPKATLYAGSTPIAGPVDMVPWIGTNYWVADFYGVFPEPNFAKAEVTYMNAQYQMTKKTDYESVIAP